ncbi:hypothetical protein [Micromonospora endophytica]|uniref:hypothetical protein n=1 Tax=Micromonospora endophytica TaxID=515350 RepID=UPI001BB452C4|nr:hypothetical protein [Micromonospora endophytica]
MAQALPGPATVAGRPEQRRAVWAGRLAVTGGEEGVPTLGIDELDVRLVVPLGTASRFRRISATGSVAGGGPGGGDASTVEGEGAGRVRRMSPIAQPDTAISRHNVIRGRVRRENIGPPVRE